MRCLYCKKRLWNPFNNSQFCTELHETWYREEQSGEAIRRLMDPAAPASGATAAPPPLVRPSMANPDEPAPQMPPRMQVPPPLTATPAAPALPPPLIATAPASVPSFQGPEPPLAAYLPETGQPVEPEYFIIAAEMELLPSGFLAVPQADLAVMEGYDPDADATVEVVPPAGERVDLTVPARDVPNVIFQEHSEPSSVEPLYAYPLSGLEPVVPDMAQAAEKANEAAPGSAPPFGGNVRLAIARELPAPPPLLAQPVAETGTQELRMPASAIPESREAVWGPEIAFPAPVQLEESAAPLPSEEPLPVFEAPIAEAPALPVIAEPVGAPLGGSISLAHYANRFAEGARILSSHYPATFDARRMPFRWPALALTPAGSFLAESVNLEQFLIATSEPEPQADPAAAAPVPIPAFLSAPLRETRREVIVEAIAFTGVVPAVANTPMPLERPKPEPPQEVPPQAPWIAAAIRYSPVRTTPSAPALLGAEKLVIHTPQPATSSWAGRTLSRRAGVTPTPLVFPKPVLDSAILADAMPLAAAVREPQFTPRQRASALDASGLQTIECQPQGLRQPLAQFARFFSEAPGSEGPIPATVGLRNPAAGLKQVGVTLAASQAIGLPVGYLIAPPRVAGAAPALTGQTASPGFPSASIERPHRGGYLPPAGPRRLSATPIRQREAVLAAPFEPRGGRTTAARVAIPTATFTTRPAGLDSPVMALAWRLENRKPAVGASSRDAFRIRPELRIPAAS